MLVVGVGDYFGQGVLPLCGLWVVWGSERFGGLGG